MTIDERIMIEEKAIKDMQFKEEALDGLPGYMVTKEDYEECRKSANEHQELINWLKELKLHREAWEKVRKGLRAKHRESYFIGIYDAMKIVDKYRPKEGD